MSSNYHINLNFDKIHEEFGSNDYTVEYYENTFIPSFFNYKKFWIEPDSGSDHLTVSNYRLELDGVGFKNETYSGIVDSFKYTLLKVLNPQDKFYINNIVFNIFDSFANNFHEFKKNIINYFNSLHHIYLREYYSNPNDKVLLKEFIYKCSDVFEYLETYKTDREFDQHILNIVEELKSKLNDLNTIIYNSKVEITNYLSDAKLVLITDAFVSTSKLEYFSLSHIVVDTVDLSISNNIKFFELNTCTIKNLIFRARTKCGFLSFEYNTINRIKFEEYYINSSFIFNHNHLNELVDLPSRSIYKFIGNELGSKAFSGLSNLIKEMKFNIKDDSDFFILVNIETKTGEEYTETFTDQSFNLRNGTTTHYDGIYYVLCDPSTYMILSTNINFEEINSKFNLNEKDSKNMITLIRLLLK